MSQCENGIQPQIRFRGFEKQWEKVKFGDVATLINGRAYSQDELLKSGFYKVLRVGNFYTNSSWYFSDMQLDEKYYANNEDLLYTWSASFGPHVWKGGKVIFHYHIWKIDLSKKLVKEFALQLLEKDKEKILNNSNGSTMIHITKEGMEAKEFSIPSPEEQVQIGSYFQELDQMIHQHQHKKDKLIALKQAMLQKMFPQHGTTIPKIRFKAFEREWGKQQLCSIVDLCSGRDYKHLCPGDIPVYGTGGYMLSVNKALSYDKDAVGIGRKGTIDRPYLLKCPFWTVDTLFYAIPKKGHNLDFIYSVFQKIDWKKYDESTGVPSLSKTAINEIGIAVPTLDEQQKIGCYFRQLDELISRHAIQLEKLIQVKSACLAKMFV